MALLIFEVERVALISVCYSNKTKPHPRKKGEYKRLPLYDIFAPNTAYKKTTAISGVQKEMKKKQKEVKVK